MGMRCSKWLVVAGCTLGSVGWASATDAAGYTMAAHVDGVSGESTGLEAGNIDLKSFQWGFVAPGGKNIPQDLTLTKLVDKTSTQLMTLAANHTSIGSVEVHVRTTAGPQTLFLKIKASDAHIVAVHESGNSASSDARPDETVMVHYEKLEVTYTPLGGDGKPNGTPVTFTHDFK